MGDKKIVAVITGMQHSGTTYLNNIINSHSRITSGFECGILLKNIKEFDTVKPFSDWLKTGKTHFGLPDDYLDKIKNMNYEEVYAYIQKNKGSKNDSYIQTLLKKCPYFTDKTPAYIYEIESIHKKIETLNIPVIITLKKYDAIYYSWVIKRKISFDVFIFNIQNCIKSLTYILNNNCDDIYVYEYDDYILQKEVYNKHFMDIITKYNNKINIEKLFEEKYNGKMKVSEKYTNDSKFKDNIINIQVSEYQNIYNNLIDKLKIKL